MTRSRLNRIPALGFVAVSFGMLLVSEWATSINTSGWLHVAAIEVQAACRDTGTQWMVLICLVSYFVAFIFLERRLVPPNVARANLWLIGFLALVILRYALDYETATGSMLPLVLVAGIVFGKGAALWVRWGNNQGKHPTLNIQHPTSKWPSAPSSIFHLPSSSRRLTILFVLTALLGVAALWQPELGMEFQYRGRPRWSGAWENPNLYGLLMGVGVVLAIGQIVLSLKSIRLCNASARQEVQSRSNAECEVRSAKWWRWVAIVLFVSAAGTCGIGLMKSYSRGAWLGTAVGLVYLLWKWISRTHLTPALSPRPPAGEGESFPRLSWFQRNAFPLSVILASVFILAFWQFRHTENPLARRVFSVANPNDFSWRNRVTAWQGAGRMMLDKPLLGFGWGKAEQVYREQYRAARLDDSAAIQMNDYLMLGICCGGPALVCFGAYIWLACRRTLGGRRVPAELRTSDVRLQTSAVCLAGAFVLLVGFWFDGGLFKLPTATVFWVLLELSRISPLPSLSPSEGERVAARPGEGMVNKRPRFPRALRWAAVILALLAIGQTALHLVVPRLAISERTLAIARKYLVPAKELADFDYLAAQPIWSGQPLRTLRQHVVLANYNRELVNWKLDDELYREFVLNPWIDFASGAELHWRRELWESFYPRIRREQNIPAAADIVVRYLGERVKIKPGETAPTGIASIWQRQFTDPRGFETIYVAALRSVGIPARRGTNQPAEFFADGKWRLAPRPPNSSGRASEPTQ